MTSLDIAWHVVHSTGMESAITDYAVWAWAYEANYGFHANGGEAALNVVDDEGGWDNSLDSEFNGMGLVEVIERCRWHLSHNCRLPDAEIPSWVRPVLNRMVKDWAALTLNHA